MVIDKDKLAEQEIKGAWAALAKVLMVGLSVVFPLVLSWAVWLTNEQMKDRAFRTSGERFTQSDANDLRTEVVDRLDTKIDRVDTRVQELERDNTRIITILERLEQKLDQ